MDIKYNYSIKDYAYLEIRKRIVTCELLPGTKISEKEMAEKLQISRTPIRESFIRLQKDGLVDIYPQKGTIVTKINLHRVEEERFVRSSIEFNLAKMCIDKIGEKEFRVLDEIILKQKQAYEKRDYYEFISYDDEFHKVFYEVCNRKMTWQLVKNNSTHDKRTRIISFWSEGFVENIIEDHRKILEAHKSRDEQQVLKLIKEHLEEIIDHKVYLANNYPQYFEEQI